MYLTKNLVNQICFDIIFKQGPPPDLITETSTSSTTPTTPDPTTTHNCCTIIKPRTENNYWSVCVRLWSDFSPCYCRLIKYIYCLNLSNISMNMSSSLCILPPSTKKKKKLNKSPKNEIYNVFHF